MFRVGYSRGFLLSFGVLFNIVVSGRGLVCVVISRCCFWGDIVYFGGVGFSRFLEDMGIKLVLEVGRCGGRGCFIWRVWGKVGLGLGSI